MSTPAIAIVGLACRYPDARTPEELWENALAQRQAFRRLPDERLRLADYADPDPRAPDRTYATEAAVIAGYSFDRARFRLAASTVRQADLTHWLALDIAALALADAGFPDGAGLPRDTTGVLLGNTLTGEFARANLLRLRWPYVRRVLEPALAGQGWPPEQRRAFLEQLEQRYKAPFPELAEESLAGGLSNTIAGRICNAFDLHGGGFTLDAACASSLLAIANACAALAAGDLDVALAGGVDLSLDPFELVGFAKTGALAPEQMRVYDARSAGFWPGEGCGFAVLMRHDDALARGARIYALIRGWGISSDGSGGITRPEVAGQLLALERAYRRAGFGIDTVHYVEGHGTGTAVGDATELRALGEARRRAGADTPAVLSSAKANIGHTKAAAGVAGLIRAALALHSQLLPPLTGRGEPHPELGGPDPMLRTLSVGEPWPADRPLRAGVSAMGFGGINTHLALESPAVNRRAGLTERERALLASAQDAELFCLAAPTPQDLAAQVERLLAIAPRLARAELADLAAQLAPAAEGPVRAALVAGRPAELAQGLEVLRSWLAEGLHAWMDPRAGVFLHRGTRAPKIGLLFPGQAAPSYRDGGALQRRFPAIGQIYALAELPQDGDGADTAIAQPAIVAAELAGLHALRACGLVGDLALGHSLGELTALAWAGALEEPALLRLARARGAAMAGLNGRPGAMASIEAGPHEVGWLLGDAPVGVACFNGPRRTVVSGPAPDVAVVVGRAQARGLSASLLPVSQAFHSPLVASAAAALEARLRDERLGPLQRPVVSTVTGRLLEPDSDLVALLCEQLTAPVRFSAALAAAEGLDLWLEVGPGHMLSGLAAEQVGAPVIAMDAGGASLGGLLRALGAAFALGAPLDRAALLAGRLVRPLDLEQPPTFFASPCEQVPAADWVATGPTAQPPAEAEQLAPTAAPAEREDALAVVRRLVAERLEMPLEAVRESDRLLSDLHLNSLVVGQLVVEAARQLQLAPPAATTEYADATVVAVAQALERRGEAGERTAPQRLPPGVASWVRAFRVELVARALPARPAELPAGGWQVYAPAGHPLADALLSAFAGAPGGRGVVVALPGEPGPQDLALLLEGAKAALLPRAPLCFVLVQQEGGGAALARTLALESSAATALVVNLPFRAPAAEAERVVAEALAASGPYTEVCYDETGRRFTPVLRVLEPHAQPQPLPLGRDDVLLVSGGGKGITAECALALARESGAALALLGRSRPEQDAELAATLERMRAAGVRWRYLSADVTDPEAVGRAVQEAEAALGPITALLHGAARNSPRLLSALSADDLAATLAPKLDGLRHLLAALDPQRLRLLVSFGSIIAQSGLPGEADYGLANEHLARETARFGAAHPHCRCLTVQWSVWSSVGMGAKLGQLEALERSGITPIPLDEGVAMLLRLLADPRAGPAPLVSGRLGGLPTLALEQAELPLWRFLEQPRVCYPGVELVVEAELSGDSDPYLDAHVYRGARLLPAVLGLEAMAQVSMALAESDRVPVLEDVVFARPISVPPGGRTAIRLAALVREPGLVEVALRSAETDFQTDHFRARCRFGPLERAPEGAPEAELPLIELDPARELYGGLLFQGGGFQRLRGYRQLGALGCTAEVEADSRGAWFGRFQPQRLVLGDPGAHDALIHAIQVCVPHRSLLPVGVERLRQWGVGDGPLVLRARERERDGDGFVYDLEVEGEDGRLRERWEGLRLQVVRAAGEGPPEQPELLGPYLERRVAELLPGGRVGCALERGGERERRGRSDQAIQHALGRVAAVRRRADGRPEVEGGDWVTASHSGELTLALAAADPVGCDIEAVAPRPEALWRDLLGQERFALARLLAQELGGDLDRTATLVWSAAEALRKLGAPLGAPLLLERTEPDGWALLGADGYRLACYIAAQAGGAPLALAVCLQVSAEPQPFRPAQIPERSRSNNGIKPPFTTQEEVL